MFSKAEYHFCAMPGCSKELRALVENLSWHSFPNAEKQTERRMSWINAVRSSGDSNWIPNASAKLCSRHFDKKCVFPNRKQATLYQSAVPTLYLNCSDNVDVDDMEAEVLHRDDLDVVEIEVCSDNQVAEDSQMLDTLSSDEEETVRHVCLTCPNCQFDIPIKAGLVDRGPPSKRRRTMVPKRLFEESEASTSMTHVYLPNEGTPLTPRSLSLTRIEHAYFKSPRTAAEKSTLKSQELQKRNDSLRLQLNRREKSLRTLQDELQESRVIGSNKLQLLQLQFPELLNELVENEFQSKSIKGKKGMVYSDEIKKFAVTLHFYSSRAYDFLRDHLTLPHPSSITSWMQSANCEPGFNTEVFERLQEARKADTRNMMTDVVFQVDEMAIRKDTPWDPNRHQYVGFVDYGTGDHTGNEPLATNALVGLIAGISGGWKCPIGYIFTNKVNGLKMKQFACRGFDLLEKYGFRVHALISDGTSSNVSMFEHLGVVEASSARRTEPPAFEEIQTFFPNPSNSTKKVYAVYDIVHMMKLMRNLLAQCKDITWEHGVIDWRYVIALKNLQQDEVIVAANKLDRNHIDFHQHKMKVKLAVQALSSSVADAIDFCREGLNLPGFAGSESTSRFIRDMDTAFDILNSRHPKQYGNKGPIRLCNLPEMREFLESFAKKLLKMTYSECRMNKGKATYIKKYICLGNRKRAPLGFVIGIKSILAASEELLQRPDQPFHYVLTYRFSQDLLELLFNKVRGRGGRNNNPNVIEFINIMKKIWHQNLLKSNSTGNCVQQTAETEIPGGLLPLRRRPQRQLPTEIDLEDLSLDCLHDRENSQFYKNCLAYIAGNIVMKISPKIDCDKCISALMDSCDDPLDVLVKTLILRKQRGGLKTPSQSVYRVVEMTDAVFRNLVNISDGPPRLPKIDARITSTILKKCIGLNLFPTVNTHVVDFDPVECESHFTKLIKAVVHLFLRIRLFDFGKRYQRSLSVSSRHSLTKQILFRND